MGIVACIATLLGAPLPLVGAPVLGLLLGALLAVPTSRLTVLQPGVRYTARTVLQVAVVLLGTQLSLRQIAEVGVTSLPVLLGTLVLCLVAAAAVGRLMRIDTELRTLIGVGTAICGASAIAAVTPVLRAKNDTVAYAVSTIFLFNLVAVLVFPHLGYALNLSQHQFGLFAGTAVNDTSSVVAAAAIYGPEAANFAVVVKLTRTLLIIPICLVLAAVVARRERAGGSQSPPRTRWPVTAVRLVPWFLIGFLMAAAANSAGWISAPLGAALHVVALFLVTAALSAIGMSTDFRRIRRAGFRPLVLGLVLWLVVTASGLGLVLATG